MRCVGPAPPPVGSADVEPEAAGPVMVRATATAGIWLVVEAASVPAERRLRSIWEKPGVELDWETDGWTLGVAAAGRRRWPEAWSAPAMGGGDSLVAGSWWGGEGCDWEVPLGLPGKSKPRMD